MISVMTQETPWELFFRFQVILFVFFSETERLLKNWNVGPCPLSPSTSTQTFIPAHKCNKHKDWTLVLLHSFTSWRQQRRTYWLLCTEARQLMCVLIHCSTISTVYKFMKSLPQGLLPTLTVCDRGNQEPKNSSSRAPRIPCSLISERSFTTKRIPTYTSHFQHFRSHLFNRHVVLLKTKTVDGCILDQPASDSGNHFLC